MAYARVVDITGKSMKGFVFIDRAGYKTAVALSTWINLGLNFTSTLPAKKTKKKIK